MKNKLIKKNLFSFLIKLIIWTIVFMLLLSLLIIFINYSDFQWVYDFSPKLYYFIKYTVISKYGDWLWIIAIIIWFGGVVVISYFLIKKVFYYVNTISKASEDLLNKDIEYIELPNELEDLQIKMNEKMEKLDYLYNRYRNNQI